MRNLKILFCLFAFCLLATACGEDTSNSSDGGGDGDDSTGSGAQSNVQNAGSCSDGDPTTTCSTGTGDSGDDPACSDSNAATSCPDGVSNSGDGDSTSGDGDSTSGDGDGDQSMDPMCDETVENVDSCGGTACDAPSGGFATMGCQVSCCVDDMCGTRTTSMNSMVPDSFRDCSLPAETDDRCPSMGGGGGMEVPGCCTSDGYCGVVFGGNCFDPSGLGMGGDPTPCDEAQQQPADAGTM